MEKYIKKLTLFNFTEIEAKIYTALLKNNEMNGSQISKILNCSRSSVYDTLKLMEEKGFIIPFEGKIKTYKAKNPEILFEELKQKWTQNAEELKHEMKNMTVSKEENQYWNIKGLVNLKLKMREVISSSQREIYITTNYPLHNFEEELKQASDRGVRIILFSFKKQEKEYPFIEKYYNFSKTAPCTDMRIMINIDNKKTIIANFDSSGEIIGTFTENPLMVRIIAEHIHHDIYISRLEETYHKNLITENIQIKTDFEKDVRDFLLKKGGI